MKIRTLLALLLAPLAALAAPDKKTTPSSEGNDSAAHANRLVTIEGKDPSFAELLESGTVKAGERFFKGKVTGSRVVVNHGLLEKQVGKIGPIPKDKKATPSPTTR